MEVLKKPKTAISMGVFQILWGVAWIYFNLLKIGDDIARGSYNGILSMLDIIILFYLAIAGFFLIINKPVAIRLCRYYVVGAVIIIILWVMYYVIFLGIAGIVASFILIALKAVMPVLVYFLITHHKKVLDFYESKRKLN